MNVHEANTKPLGPVWTCIAGLALLAVGCGMLCFVLVGLKSGEIWRLSIYHRGLVTREESPSAFWYFGGFLLFHWDDAVWICSLDSEGYLSKERDHDGEQIAAGNTGWPPQFRFRGSRVVVPRA